MKTSTQNFSEFQGNENGLFRMRLGQSIYVQKGSDVYWVNRSGVLILVSEETHVTKPWIRENFERERKFQKRKAKAELFNQPCFKRTPYSANQRIAYNNTKYN